MKPAKRPTHKVRPRPSSRNSPKPSLRRQRIEDRRRILWGILAGTATAGGLLYWAHRATQPEPIHDFRLAHGKPSLSSKTINSILHKTPLSGQGPLLISLSNRYNIDPAYALAFFKQESSYGSKGLGAKNKNPGNIKGYVIATGADGKKYKKFDFLQFERFEDGIEAWYRLIANGSHYYRANRFTLEDILHKYAPPSENPTRTYIKNVQKSVENYREKEKELSQQNPSRR